jgi:hypothetical protein
MRYNLRDDPATGARMAREIRQRSAHNATPTRRRQIYGRRRGRASGSIVGKRCIRRAIGRCAPAKVIVVDCACREGYLEGGYRAVDDLCDSFGLVALRARDVLHPGRIHPYPPGHRHCRGVDPGYSRAQTGVAASNPSPCSRHYYAHIAAEAPDRKLISHRWPVGDAGFFSGTDLGKSAANV